MDTFFEQRICIKFCFKLGKSASETCEMLKSAFKEEVIGHSTIFEWYSAFKSGRTLCYNEPKSGRPPSCRNPEISK